MVSINQITIIGLGLIGGSLALALKKNNPSIKIIGIDVCQENLKIAIERNAIDKGTIDAKEGVINSDIVFLATPISSMFEVAQEISPYLKNNCIISDVGSCKVEVIRLLGNILPPSCHFIGGHPMAGSEQAGMIHADSYLFQNAVYVLTPQKNINEEAVELLQQIIQTTGANVIKIDPYRHDLIVAAVSHLPHLVAINLVNTVGEFAEQDNLTLALAAGGFRDTTRIAMGNETIWADIFRANMPMLLQVFDSFKNNLLMFESLILKAKHEELKKLILKSKLLRQKIPLKPKGLLPMINELTLTVPDEPGIIAKIATILSEENINIIDIEILRVREREEGAIRVGLKSKEDLDSAISLLRKNNFEVKRR